MRIANPAFVLLAASCAPRDVDDDGIPDKQEEALGLDPLDADSDDDGLSDADEVALGSDGLDPDTDDDGLDDLAESELGTALDDPDTDDDTYTDRDEVFEGTDPLDASSVIYEGGWPYYFEKTELNGGAVFEVGKRFANLELVDQFGDRVSLWDFHNHSRYVMVEICIEKSGLNCDTISQWLTGDEFSYLDRWSVVAEAVASGQLYWITILNEDENSEPETADDVAAWAEAYPNPLVPVLADPENGAPIFVGAYDLPASFYYPYLVLLDPDLKVNTIQSSDVGFPSVLDAAIEILSAGSPGTQSR